jgi:hypothetical protein
MTYAPKALFQTSNAGCGCGPACRCDGVCRCKSGACGCKAGARGAKCACLS